MIKITIEKVMVEKYIETKNFIVKSTPTDKTESKGGWDSGNKVLCEEEYATKEITAERTVRTTLLQQEIAEVERFNLNAVIAAINNMDNKPKL